MLIAPHRHCSPQSLSRIFMGHHGSDLRHSVNICMLSRLLYRLLERRLKGEWTSARALEDLHSCHLNEYKLV